MVGGIIKHETKYWSAVKFNNRNVNLSAYLFLLSKRNLSYIWSFRYELSFIVFHLSTVAAAVHRWESVWKSRLQESACSMSWNCFRRRNYADHCSL